MDKLRELLEDTSSIFKFPVIEKDKAFIELALVAMKRAHNQAIDSCIDNVRMKGCEQYANTEGDESRFDDEYDVYIDKESLLKLKI